MAQQQQSTLSRQFQKVCAILEENRNDPSRLIPILHGVQREYRYLPREVLTYLATALGLSPAHVYGVASFYSHFTLTPKGKYVVRICDGTACHVKNSSGLLQALQEALELSPQQNTTPDMLFTVETVSCLGACGLAPVMLVNDDVHGQVTPQKAAEIIISIKNSEVTK